MHFNLKKLLPMRFMQRKGKFIVLQTLIVSCFLFFHTTLLAIPPEAIKELALLSAVIEEKILPIVETSERGSYENLLANLSSDNPHIVKQGLKGLMRAIAKKPPAGVDPVILGSIQNRLVLVQDTIETEPFDKLEARTDKYFRGIFEDRLVGIKFLEKTDGVQLGRRAIITLKGTVAPITYYVKTHRGGLLSPTQTSGSAGPKPVDPKELFVYKVFELAGIGPEVHFFFDDAKNFYIATKDAGFDELDRKQKGFLRYGQLAESEVQSIGAAMQRILEIADAWDAAKSKTLADAEGLESKLTPTGLNILRGLAVADIISRMFSLTDFIINTGNIGFIVDDNLSKFRIIDFMVSDGEYEVYGIFSAFLKGNGRHRYIASANEITRYALYSRQIDKKVQIARDVMKDLTAEHAGGAGGGAAVAAEPTRGKLSEKTLDEASLYVKKLMQSCAAVSGSAAAGVTASGGADAGFLGSDKDLNEYIVGVKANLKAFGEGLASYTSAAKP